MLISFRVRNFRSFAEDAILSMRPIAAYDELQENVGHFGNVDVLKIAAIYGPNAGGKSNFVKAVGRMRSMVLDSLKTSSVDALPIEPFELNANSREEPTEFDVTMLVGKRIYRYGFVANEHEIVAEWLFASTGGARAVEHPVFIREGNSLHSFSRRYMPELADFQMKTLLSNALLLPRMDQLNNACAKDVLEWFKSLGELSGSRDNLYGRYSLRRINDAAYHETMLRLIRFADMTIDDVEIDHREFELDGMTYRNRRPSSGNTLPFASPSLRVNVKMKRRDNLGHEVLFDLMSKESEGTAKMFALSGPLADTLLSGGVLVIDELEAKLHPLLTRRIVRLFQSPRLNPRNAQLIFVAHDATLLRSAGLRRDQIWFCEKARSGASSLYCLAEVKVSAKARREDDFERKYLEGRYGAVPIFERGSAS